MDRLELSDKRKLEITLLRLCAELREEYGDFQNSVLLGIQPRGVYFAGRMFALLQERYPDNKLQYGELDVTFFRDDFRRHDNPLIAQATRLDFNLEQKRVILADDVLFTGRTIRAALDALLSWGRPQDVRLLILVDRSRKRELPVHSDFSGFRVDTLANEKVLVEWAEKQGKDSIRIEIRSTSPDKS